MKRPSNIAKELRNHGRKFSQTSFLADLKEFTPVFKEGNVAFYEDSVVETLMSKYKVRAPYVSEVAPVSPPVNTQLDNIEKMLAILCKSFDLPVEA